MGAQGSVEPVTWECKIVLQCSASYLFYTWPKSPKKVTHVFKDLARRDTCNLGLGAKPFSLGDFAPLIIVDETTGFRGCLIVDD